MSNPADPKASQVSSQAHADEVLDQAIAVNAYERALPNDRVNPVSLVQPSWSMVYWDEDMAKLVTDVPESVQQLLELGFDSREIDLLVEKNTDPALAAVILIQRLGPEGAKAIQRDVPATRGDLMFEDVVGEMIDQPNLLDMQRQYCFIQDYGGHVRIAWHDTEGRFRTRTVQSHVLAHSNNFIEITVQTNGGTGTKKVKTTDVWLRSPNRRTFTEARFMPGQRPSPGLGIYNLWQGWPVGQARGIPRRMIEHIKQYMCGGDEDTFEWVIGWLADAVQNVHRTPTTALVLAGPQGSGKNVFCELLFELFAPHTLMITQPQQLVGNFNSHLMDRLFVFANEAFFAGNKKDANALKSLVTDREMTVEPKGVDAFPVKKHFRLILASNEDRVVDLEIDDRRYAVLRADAGAFNNDRDYFGELITAWRERGEREMFLRMLCEWNLREWNEGAIPETEARMQQRELSLPKGAREVYSVLCEGGGPELVAHCPETGAVALKSQPEWSKGTGKFFRLAGGERGQIAGSGRVWWLPPLGEARKLFAQELKVRPDWVQDEMPCWDTDQILFERPFPF